MKNKCLICERATSGEYCETCQAALDAGEAWAIGMQRLVKDEYNRLRRDAIGHANDPKPQMMRGYDIDEINEINEEKFNKKSGGENYPSVELPLGSVPRLLDDTDDVTQIIHSLMEKRQYGFDTSKPVRAQFLSVFSLWMIQNTLEVGHKGLPEGLKSPEMLSRHFNTWRVANGLKPVSVQRYEQLLHDAKETIAKERARLTEYENN